MQKGVRRFCLQGSAGCASVHGASLASCLICLKLLVLHLKMRVLFFRVFSGVARPGERKMQRLKRKNPHAEINEARKKQRKKVPRNSETDQEREANHQIKRDRKKTRREKQHKRTR